jgi:hypothetical protein
MWLRATGLPTPRLALQNSPQLGTMRPVFNQKAFRKCQFEKFRVPITTLH